MTLWRPDPSFYPSARMAMGAPRERHAYVAALNPGRPGVPDAICTVDLDPGSPTYSQIVHQLDLPNVGDELHHFGWNACSSALCPAAAHPHLERRYLIVPGLRSSRIYVVDTQPDPRRPTIAKTIEPETLKARTGYSRPHTVHCGPDAIYISALGGTEDGKGPGGVFLLDHFTFEPLGAWEIDRGDQFLAYDFWWHYTQDIMVTSEWGEPRQFENGIVPDELLGKKYGHRIHFWDLRRRKRIQVIDIGDEHQMLLELRPAHEPRKTYGFFGVVISVADLSASIWTWYRENGTFKVRKIVTIPAEPADPAVLPPALKPFGAVPPLVTDIDLSLDDRFLYVSCWGTGEMRQYDVSDPFAPKLAGTVQLGGIVRKAGHPKAGALKGGPQMVEISRDGQRIYFTNGLYSSWDQQFYPEGMPGWMVKLDAGPDGGISVDPEFMVTFGEASAHQVRLEGGDASTDTFCFPS